MLGTTEVPCIRRSVVSPCFGVALAGPPAISREVVSAIGGVKSLVRGRTLPDRHLIEDSTRVRAGDDQSAPGLDPQYTQTELKVPDIE